MMRRMWPLGVPLAILGFVCMQSVSARGGTVGYALDDAYIHMAIAKHIVQNGVHGVTPYEFSASSSSPAWTALLTGFFAVIGVREAIPLALNIAALVAVLLLSVTLLEQAGVPSKWSPSIAATIGVLVPLPFLVMTGMEHTLQVATALFFCLAFLRWITSDRGFGVLLAASLSITAVRYEGFALVLGAIVIAMIGRRWREALAVASTSLVVPVAYGAMCASQGWPWVPISILLKAAAPTDLDVPITERLIERLIASPPLVLLAVGLALHLIPRIAALRASKPSAVLASLALFAIVPQLLLVTSLPALIAFRYQAYSLTLGVVAMVAAWHDCADGRARLTLVQHVRERSIVIGIVATIVASVIDAMLVSKGIRWLPGVLVYPAIIALSIGIAELAPFGGFAAMSLVSLGVLWGEARGLGALGRVAIIAASYAMGSIAGFLWASTAPGRFTPRAALGFAPLCLAALLHYSIPIYRSTPTAVTNIDEQQGQMARFAMTLPRGTSVAMNDIGAMNFAADLRIVDIFGLASLDVARAALSGQRSSRQIQRACETRNCRYGVFYESWFPKPIPPTWIRVQRWTIDDNLIAGDRTVSFYALEPDVAPELRARLDAFVPSLPKSVRVDRG